MLYFPSEKEDTGEGIAINKAKKEQKVIKIGTLAGCVESEEVL